MATCQKKVWKLIMPSFGSESTTHSRQIIPLFLNVSWPSAQSIVLFVNRFCCSFKRAWNRIKTVLTVFQKNTRLMPSCNAWMVLCEAATEHYMSKCLCEIQVPKLSQSGREGAPSDQRGGTGHTHTNIQWPMGAGQFLPLNVSILLERHHWIFVWQGLCWEKRKNTTFKPKKIKDKQGWREYSTVSWGYVLKSVLAGHPWVGTLRQEGSPSEWLKFLVILLTQGRSTRLTSQPPMLKFCAATSVSLLLHPFWD